MWRYSLHTSSDVFVKSTDTHQYLHATSCHVYHSGKSIPYSQVQHFNRVCSENHFFDKRYNDLEVWLSNRGYNEQLVRQQILKVRKYRTTELLIIGFKKGKSLKDVLVRTKVPPLKTEKGFCGPCNKPRCGIFKYITKTHQFESSSTKIIYSIRPQNLNWVSKNVVYFFTCKTCHKQYTGSTELLRSRFDNQRCLHRNFFRNKKS